MGFFFNTYDKRRASGSIHRSNLVKKTARNLPTNQGDLFACVWTSMEPKQNCLQRAFRIANNGNTSFGILEQVTTAIQLPSNHSRHQRLAVLYPLRTVMVRWASPIALHLTSIRRSNDWINMSLFLGLQLSMSYLSIIINHHFSWRYSSINYGGITIVLMDTEIDDN